MHVSAFTPHQCRFVHIQVRDRFVFIHMRVLLLDACGTTRPRQRTQICAKCHGARVLKLPRLKCALQYCLRSPNEPRTESAQQH